MDEVYDIEKIRKYADIIKRVSPKFPVIDPASVLEALSSDLSIPVNLEYLIRAIEFALYDHYLARIDALMHYAEDLSSRERRYMMGIL